MNFKDTLISQCIVHKVGNKNRKEFLQLSENVLELSENLEKELQQFFLNPFKSNWEAYQFHHEIDLKMNEVFVCVDNIFENKGFVENSVNIASHLFKQTRHPLVKSGELFVTSLIDIVLDDTIVNGVGLFKSENKETFFDVDYVGNNIDVQLKSGISKRTLDKGCIILESDYKNGYKVFVYERNGADTDYWRNDFLAIMPRADEFHQTSNFLSLCRDYVVHDIPQNFKLSKAEQIDLLNKSINYFNTNEVFNIETFQQEVFQNEAITEAFEQFQMNKVDSEGNEQYMDSFMISKYATKKQAKIFKSVLKLDKNFHVYIHGDKKLIEKGYDKEKGKNFYKIYFDEEN